MRGYIMRKYAAAKADDKGSSGLGSVLVPAGTGLAGAYGGAALGTTLGGAAANAATGGSLAGFDPGNVFKGAWESAKYPSRVVEGLKQLQDQADAARSKLLDAYSKGLSGGISREAYAENISRLSKIADKAGKRAGIPILGAILGTTGLGALGLYGGTKLT